MGRNSEIIRYDSKVNNGQVGGILNETMMSNRSGTHSLATDELNYILWFSIAFGICEIIEIYIKYDFLNVTM